jgi:hypothetical protein
MGFIAVALTAGLMVLVMAALLPSGSAAAGEATYTSSFTQPCVVGPGILNVKANLKVTTISKGPASVRIGETVTFSNTVATITAPKELSNTFAYVGAKEVSGVITNFVADSTSLSPASMNIAEPAEFPGGLPYAVPVLAETEMTFTAPTPPATFSFGPLVVTGPSPNATLTMDTAPGFKEIGVGEYEGTGNGIIAQANGYNAEHAKVIGPLTVACNPPAGVVLASIPIATGPPPPPPTTTTTTTTTTPCFFRPQAYPRISGIEPSHGPGGTSVTIKGSGFSGPIDGPYESRVTAVLFGNRSALYTVNSDSSITAFAPGGTGTVGVQVAAETYALAGNQNPACPSANSSNSVPFTYGSFQTSEYRNWAVSGMITDKRSGSAIVLPAGSTFNGSGEVNVETGAGSVKGKISVPAFYAPIKLVGILPASLGVTITQAGELQGTVTKSEALPGEEVLSIPASLRLAVTSVGILGLRIPTHCVSAEPMALALKDTLSLEELLSDGWSFRGSTTLSSFTCEGGLLGSAFGSLLSSELSGPENTYSLSIRPPSA